MINCFLELWKGEVRPCISLPKILATRLRFSSLRVEACFDDDFTNIQLGARIRATSILVSEARFILVLTARE